MKKTISAEIIADSKNKVGDRITTFVLTFPRIILAELNTHRAFSRNSASSRAIPFDRMLEMVKEDPFMPIAFQKDHKGMQGNEYYKGEDLKIVKNRWKEITKITIESAKWLAMDVSFYKKGVTKQLCNRILEPFMWHTAIVTATEFENFFKQRCPQYKYISDAGEVTIFRSKKDYVESVNSVPEDFKLINKGQGEIHIMELAEQMWDNLNNSKAKELKAGEFHIPFGDNIDIYDLHCTITKDPSVSIPKEVLTQAKLEIAIARCARVSYMNFEGTSDYSKDMKLFKRLKTMGHWSPFEHCAMAEDVSLQSGNFTGFVQYRQIIEKL